MKEGEAQAFAGYAKNGSRRESICSPSQGSSSTRASEKRAGNSKVIVSPKAANSLFFADPGL
jgi:hypothetical protein